MPWRQFLERQAEAEAAKARRAAAVIDDLRRLSGSLAELTDQLADIYGVDDDDD